MSEKNENPAPESAKRGKGKRPTRKLSAASRLRERLRVATDGILGTDFAWSVLLVAVVVSLLGAQRCGTDFSEYAVGDVAPRDVRAPRDGEVIDIEATERRRREARETVTEVYVHDADRGARLGAQLSEIFTDGRRVLEELSLEGVDDADRMAAERLSGLAPTPVLEQLIARRFDPTLEHELKGALSQVMSGMVTGNKTVLERESAITVVRIPGEATETLESYEAIIDVVAARRAVRERVRQRLREDSEPLGELMASFVDSNLNPDAEQTLRLREQRERDVPTLLKRIPQGALVVRAGETIDADTVRVLRSLERGANRVGLGQYLAGIVLIASLLAFFIFRYATYHQRHFRRVAHLHALLVLVLVSMLGLTQFVLWLASKVSEGLAAPFNDASSYAYLVPLAAGSILVTLLANGRIAIVYAAFASFLFGMITGWNPYLGLWAMVAQCAAIYAISSDRERTALIRAGFVVGSVGAVTAIALQTIRGELEPLSATFYCATLALVGGTVGIGPLTSFLLPILERIFNVLTDVRLLELSSGNHPLLQQLAVKAPGTYNHSLVVGTLAEEAARAIGANDLFCRVAASYHDVGKMNMPEYFVENQQHGNPHDRLAPSMSALIIASHVKDGIKMAREANLPQQIIDIVPQHHGTRLMSFFYEKAKQNADPSLGSVKEEDFRYPGPKPQSREAAIFMIADGVEAAARTIDEPTANRLQDMITKITNAIVIERQLDECELTFADLTRIQDALLKRLVAMYHHRVDYPGFDFGNAKAPSADDSTQEREVVKGG